MTISSSHVWILEFSIGKMVDNHLEFIVCFLAWRKVFNHSRSKAKCMREVHHVGHHHPTLMASLGGCGEQRDD